jgi:hypothetical protein
MAGQSDVSWFTNIEEMAEYTDRREIGNALRLECEVHKRRSCYPKMDYRTYEKNDNYTP